MSLPDGIAMLLGDIDGLAYSEAEGGNVFVDHMPSEPNECVGVFAAAGDEADSKLPYDPEEFQVIVRGSFARAILAAVYSKLHGKRNATLPDGTYVAFILATQAGPVPLGPDDNGRYAWSYHFRTEVLNPTEHRPA